MLDPTHSDTQIDVWLLEHAEISEDNVIDQAQTLLNDNEKERQARFAFPKDKQQFALTRALLKTTLTKYFPNIAPMEWHFTTEKFGKPIIANSLPMPFHFNLSHTRECIGLAVRAGVTLGFDIEDRTRQNNLSALAKHCFTEKEQEYIFADQHRNLNQRFFTYWTLKEALIKATGRGLAMGLTQLEFTIGKSKICIGPISKEYPQNWWFNSHIMRDYAFALAAPTEHVDQQLTVKYYYAKSSPFCNFQPMTP